MTPIIRAENLFVNTQDGRPLINDLSFSLQPGKSLLLHGPNGTGKTTLLRALLKLHPLQSGQVHLSIDSKDIGFLPQLGNVRLFLPLLVEDVLRFYDPNGDAIARTLSLGLLREEELKRPWNSSSGGERQKALICRALISQPKLLALDEPLNHLDSSSRRACLSLLQRYLDGEFGDKGSLILISHEFSLETLRIDATLDLGAD